MIEIVADEDGVYRTPFVETESGAPVVAVPVAAEAAGDGESVELRRIFLGERENGVGVVLVGGVRVSTPQIVSGSIGVILGSKRETHCAEMCVASGVLLQAEPGLGGGKLSVGYAWGLGQGVGDIFLLPMGGVAVKFSALQTWGRTWSVAPGQTYIGGELDISAFLLKFSIGLMKRVAGEAEGDDWLFTIGGGFGF